MSEAEAESQVMIVPSVLNLIRVSLSKPPQSPKKAKKRAEGASSNVFSMFEQAQIQEFKEVSARPNVFFHVESEHLTVW